MCKYFSRYRQKRNRPVATALRLRPFALVEWDDNAFFPFSWNSSRGPHIGDDFMQSFTDWLFGTFQKFCSYAICTCSSTILLAQKDIIQFFIDYTENFLNWLRTSCVVSIITVVTWHTRTADFWDDFEQRINSMAINEWSISIPKDGIWTRSIVTVDTVKHFIIRTETLFV